MPNATVLRLRRVTLVPLREFHVEHGQGRTVAVLFRVAVDHVDHPQGDGDQDDAGNQAMPKIGGGL